MMYAKLRRSEFDNFIVKLENNIKHTNLIEKFEKEKEDLIDILKIYFLSEHRLKKLARMVIRRQHRKHYTPIAISGYPGYGKSTFSIILAKHIFYLKSKWFDWGCLVYQPDVLEDKIDNDPEGNPIIIDESIDIFFKRDAQSSLSKRLIRLINKCRWRKLCLIFVIPDFWSLDKEVRKLVLRWIIIHKRGKSFMMKRMKYPYYSDDMWYKKHNEKVLDKVKNLSTGQIKRLKGFSTFLRFRALHDDEEERYLQIQTEKKKTKYITEKEALEEELKKIKVESAEERENIVKSMVETEMKDQDIVEKTGLKRSYVYRIRKKLYERLK